MSCSLENRVDIDIKDRSLIRGREGGLVQMGGGSFVHANS